MWPLLTFLGTAFTGKTAHNQRSHRLDLSAATSALLPSRHFIMAAPPFRSHVPLRRSILSTQRPIAPRRKTRHRWPGLLGAHLAVGHSATWTSSSS